MKSFIKLVMAAAIYLLCTVVAQQQATSARLLELSLEIESLITQTNKCHFHTAEPYPKALMRQLETGMKEISDLVESVASYVCAALLNEIQALDIQILIAKHRLFLLDMEKRVVDASAGAEHDVEGWMIGEGLEVEDAGL